MEEVVFGEDSASPLCILDHFDADGSLVKDVDSVLGYVF